MNEAMHSAAALAFLGDTIDLDELERLMLARRVRLFTTDGVVAPLHLNGDPDGLVAELLRLARIGFEVGFEAHRHPHRRVSTVVLEVEARLRRRPVFSFGEHR